MSGLHQEITLSFMIAGHTKFSPDWCFGLWKKRYRRTQVGGLSDLVDVVNQSSSVNHAQPTSQQDGQIVVPTQDWQSYLSQVFTKLKGIKKLHHLRFCASSPGMVFCKETADSDEISIDLLRSSSSPVTFSEQPETLIPSGLSLNRQWYLYQKIREFCPDKFKDITCPLPIQAQSSSHPSEDQTHSRSPSPNFVEVAEPPAEPPTKKARLCSLCHKTGHNARTCPTK